MGNHRRGTFVMTTCQGMMIAEQAYIGPPMLDFSQYNTSPFVSYLAGSFYLKMANPGTLPHGPVMSIDRSPNGRWVAVADYTGTAGVVKIYDMSSGAPVYYGGLVSAPTQSGYLCIRFSPDSTKLIVCGSTSPYVSVFNVSNWTLTTSPAPGVTSYGASWSPDSTKIALTFDASPYLKIYDTATGSVSAGQPTTMFTNGSWTPPAWSPDGAHLAAMSTVSDRLWVWRTDTWDRISSPATMPASENPGQNNSLGWSPDSSRLITCANSTPFFYSYTLSGHTLTYEAAPATLPPSASQGVAFNPAGTKAFLLPGSAPFL